jgi:hypothetical protein
MGKGRQERLRSGAQKAAAKGKTKKAEMMRARARYGTKNPRVIAKQMAYESLRKSKQGIREFEKDPSQFGMTEAERQGMVGESMAAAGQAAAAQQAGMARQGMGQGGFQAGYMQKAARQLGAAPSQAAAQASMQARMLSEAKIGAEQAKRYAAADVAKADLDEVFRKRLAARQQTMSDVGAGAEAFKDVAEGAAAAGLVSSDIRLKEDVERVGTSPSGIPVYHFRYIDSPELFEGAMAQDLLETHPESVTVGANGYYRIFYSDIDVEFRQVDKVERLAVKE